MKSPGQLSAEINNLGFAARMLVVLRRPKDLAEPQRALLHDILGLTNAEAGVALAVANGMSREQVAAERRVSVQTVNAQLKSIFRKSDVEREAALAALVNRVLR